MYNQTNSLYPVSGVQHTGRLTTFSPEDVSSNLGKGENNYAQWVVG